MPQILILNKMPPKRAAAQNAAAENERESDSEESENESESEVESDNEIGDDSEDPQFDWRRTFYRDINRQKVRSMQEFFARVSDRNQWTQAAQRARHQNFSNVDTFEQSRASFHDSGNDPDNLGPYLTHLEESFSKKNPPNFKEWQETILFKDGFPDSEANEVEGYIKSFNRLLTAFYPNTHQSDQWKLRYQSYHVAAKELEEIRCFIPNGFNNSSQGVGFVGGNPVYSRLAPPQHSDVTQEPSEVDTFPDQHPAHGMHGRLVCQDWEPTNVNTWSLLGWYKYYKVRAWNPTQTIEQGNTNPLRIEQLSDTYNKSRAFKSHWQLMAWMVLFDKNGTYNEEAAKWALAPGRMPKRDIQHLFQKEHWTRSGDSRRVVSQQDPATQNVKFVPDEKDTRHWRSYDDCPFSHHVLHDISGYSNARNENDPTNVMGVSFGAPPPMAHLNNYGSVTLSERGKHLLGTHTPGTDATDNMFPDSLHLNDPADFEAKMRDESEDMQLRVLQQLVKSLAAIVTLYHDEYPA